MCILNRLLFITENEELQEFLQENIVEIHDYFINVPYSELREFRVQLKTYFFENSTSLRSINTNNSANKQFILLLLDVFIKLGDSLAFQRMHRMIENKNIDLGALHRASSLYLVNVRTLDDYIAKIDGFIMLMTEAVETDYDDLYKTSCALLRFYAHVVHNFIEHNLNGVDVFRQRFEEKLQNFPLIFTSFVKEVFTIHNSDLNNEIIHNEIDKFLYQIREEDANANDLLLLEENTDYAHQLSYVNPYFAEIRAVSVDFYRRLNYDAFNTLNRGTAIIQNEAQLFTYMYSFGNMHYQKLISSFEFCNFNDVDDSICLVDWGAGQGIGSMNFLEYFEEIQNKVAEIMLIEPSEIALKRGHLHIKTINSEIKVKTLNYDFDSLRASKFSNIQRRTKIHLFSNILDVDHFSMSNLCRLIKSEFSGVNYFICTSPHINSLRSSRLTNFVAEFSRGNDNFEMIADIENRRNEWINSWSRIVKIFKVSL